MKKTKKLLILLLVTAVLSAGITLAFMFRSTESVENQFEPAEVACKVNDSFDDHYKTSIDVENSGNVPCYVRVRLVTYWVDKNDQIVGLPSPTLNIDLDEGWRKGEDDTFYYLTSLPTKTGKTSNLLKSPLELQTKTFNGETVYQVVNVFAEAIQAEPIEAVEEAWPKAPFSQN